MKKVIYSCAVALSVLALSSCGSFKMHTATTLGVPTSMTSKNVADLKVEKRVVFTYNTTAEDRKGGPNNCIRAAVAACLQKNGNADILVAPEYSYDGKLMTIVVTGRPASYTNFKGINDWDAPVPAPAPVPCCK